MKKQAYTLMEILVVLFIISVLSTIMFNNLKRTNSGMNDKLSVSKVLKVIDAVQQASVEIREHENSKCPMQAFMVYTAGTWEYTLLNSSGTDATTDDVLTLYQDYLRFQEAPLNFCDYTSYCDDDTIKGGKLFDDVYIGFKIYGNSIADCPNYYMPGDGTELTGKGKCWGTLYIKLADPQNNANALGQDVFIYGLNENGVAY